MGYKTALVASATFLLAINTVGAGTKTASSGQGGNTFRLPLQSFHYSDRRFNYQSGGGGLPPMVLAKASVAVEGEAPGVYSGFHQTGVQVVKNSPVVATKKVRRKERRKNERVPNSLLPTQRTTSTEVSYVDQQRLIAELDREVTGQSVPPVSTVTDAPLDESTSVPKMPSSVGEGGAVLSAVTSGYSLHATKIATRKRLVVDDSSGIVLATNMRSPSVPYLQVSSGGCQHRIGEFSVVDDPLRQAVGMDGCINPSGFTDVPQLSKSPWEATVILDLNGMTVAEAVKIVLSIPGYELLRHGPSIDKRTSRMLSLPVPRAQRRLRATSVTKALELLAGPRIVIAVDHAARLVAFDQSPVYASLKTGGWGK